jgi:hypothetical protein
MPLVIATKPARRIKNPGWRIHRGGTQKFVQVQPNGKFKFVTDANQATIFKSASDFLTAVGVRAQKVRKVTNDLTWADAQVSGVTVGRFANGA